MQYRLSVKFEKREQLTRKKLIKLLSIQKFIWNIYGKKKLAILLRKYDPNTTGLQCLM